MEQKRKVLVLILLLIALVAVFWVITKAITVYTGYNIFSPKYTDLEGFAKCLTDNNAKMYGSKYCPYCARQKAVFGESFKFINYIECIDTPEYCQNLEGVPAWEINGKLVYGIQSLDKLSELSECELK